MTYIKRAIKAFITSSVVSCICLLIIELTVRALDIDFCPMTPEFINRFPSATIALEVNILLYGIYGATFAGMSFLYDIDRLGFVLQTVIYAITTTMVWLPIVIFTWQLNKYPTALIYTIAGFIGTYVIMIIVNFNATRKAVKEINSILSK